MLVEAERLICTNRECKGEIIVVKKPALERQNLRCSCGSEMKKIYHAPKLKVLATVLKNVCTSEVEVVGVATGGRSTNPKTD
jgi:hypothetical protein